MKYSDAKGPCDNATLGSINIYGFKNTFVNYKL